MSETQQSQPSQDEQPNEKDSVGARLQPVETGASYEPPPMKTLQRRLVVLSLCLTLFLCALDTTILATALPTIGKELHVSAREYAWIGSSYTLSTTAVTPVWAKVSDIVGRKVSMMTSTGLFMAGSLICALANSSGMLIGGRTVQGLGGKYALPNNDFNPLTGLRRRLYGTYYYSNRRSISSKRSCQILWHNRNSVWRGWSHWARTGWCLLSGSDMEMVL